jgi:ribonuclease BN (tRNA processing enzyme)
MELRVLGCWSPYPAPGGAMNGYLVRHGSTALLIDGGSGVAARLQQYIPIESLTAVIVSHLHEDHISDLHALRFMQMAAEQQGRTNDRLRIWAPAEPVEQRRWLEGGERWVDLRTYDPTQPLVVGELEIRFFPTQHPIPTCAMRIEPVGGGPVLFYTADTGWHPPLIEAARGADLLLVEASLTEEYASKRSFGHLTAAEAAQFGMEAGVKRCLLTHLYPGIDLTLLLREAQEVWPRAELIQEGGRYIL